MYTQNPMTMNGQYQNPYQNSYMFQNQRTEIIKVNGENGARAFQIAPNSSALLLDTNEPIVWLVQSDGAGYKTISAYSISPLKQAEMNLNEIEARLSRLEEQVNAKSDTSNVKSNNKQ